MERRKGEEKKSGRKVDRRRDEGEKTGQRSGSLERGSGETASTRARFVPQLLPEASCVTTAQFVRTPPPTTIARKG